MERCEEMKQSFYALGLWFALLFSEKKNGG
jgi:hypothetical protein